MKLKKRLRLRNFGLVLSSFVSLAAPYGSSSLLQINKPQKETKKSGEARSAPKATWEVIAAGPPRPDALPLSPTPFARKLTAEFHEENLAWHLPALATTRLLQETVPVLKRFADVAPRFLWHTQITTTVFWIGEQPTANNPTPNDNSCWDANWTRNYGGFDNPDRNSRRGYFPAAFTPKMNPFYVALPYNDLCSEGHKSEAVRVVPWYKDSFRKNNQSVCKDRWIAIRKGDHVCYAQWEDAGPGCTTDADYVFGQSAPKRRPVSGAGLDISPAIRDYLAIGDSDITDWCFVDEGEVPTGPWSGYDRRPALAMNRAKTE